MFFIGIFGIHSEEKKVGEIKIENYPDFPIGIKADFYRACEVFEFFFVPLFRFNKRYYVIFPNSNNIFLVKKELAEDSIRRGETISYFDLEESGYVDSRCPFCGRMLEGEYKFCPFCGEKL